MSKSESRDGNVRARPPLYPRRDESGRIEVAPGVFAPPGSAEERAYAAWLAARLTC